MGLEDLEGLGACKGEFLAMSRGSTEKDFGGGFITFLVGVVSVFGEFLLAVIFGWKGFELLGDTGAEGGCGAFPFVGRGFGRNDLFRGVYAGTLDLSMLVEDEGEGSDSGDFFLGGAEFGADTMAALAEAVPGLGLDLFSVFAPSCCFALA